MDVDAPEEEVLAFKYNLSVKNETSLFSTSQFLIFLGVSTFVFFFFNKNATPRYQPTRPN